jgi:hypothetical protein
MARILHKQVNQDGTSTIVFPSGETQLLVVATGKPPYVCNTMVIPKEKLRETLDLIFNGHLEDACKKRLKKSEHK